MKETDACTSLSIDVTCPYCGHYQDRLDDLTDHLEHDELSAEKCEAELDCEECGETFLVTRIWY